MKKTKKRLFFTLITLLFCNVMLLAQDKRVITGVVTDNTGKPVQAATITEKGTKKSVVSDEFGSYSIAVSKANAVLVVTSVGAKSREINTGNETKIAIELDVAVGDLGVVVVTALGIRKEKRKLGYAVSEIKGSEIAKGNELNPINAMVGKVAGLSVDQTASGTFGSSRVQIRGNSTLRANNQPIFVVDGVIIENAAVNGGRDFGNDIKNLNSEDFETVSVLKGSSAAALYGSRAINGVILITTKKGRASRGIGVTVSQSNTIHNPFAGPDFQNEFGGGREPRFTDGNLIGYKPEDNRRSTVFPLNSAGEPFIQQHQGKELENWGPKFNGQQVRNYDGTRSNWVAQPNNFLDAFQNGTQSRTNVAISGGNEKSTFRFSFTNEGQRGLVEGNKADKNSFNLRATHGIAKWLSADVSVDYTQTKITNPQNLSQNGEFASFSGNNFGKAFSWVIPRNYDTKYWSRRENYISQVYGGMANMYDPTEPNHAINPDLWFYLYENDYTQAEQMMRARLSLTATLTNWAKFIVETNISNNNLENEDKELGMGRGFTGGRYGRSNGQRHSEFLKGMFLFDKKLSDAFTLSGNIGGEIQRYKNSTTAATTNGGLLYPGTYYLNNSIQAVTGTGGISYKKGVNSVYVSADLDYKSQLYLNLSWRGDQSSSLTKIDGTGNFSYSYPAVSASWLFSETFKLPEFITYGKLRGNLAQLGNDADPFTINPGYQFVLPQLAVPNGTLPLATFNSSVSVDPNLKPERKVAQEIGLEMRFFKNRVGFELNLYKDNTYDQILDIPAPRESGLTGLKINAGNIQNKGIEFTIDGSPVKGKNFEWNSSFNIASNRNRIVELYPGRNEYSLGGGTFDADAWAIVGKSYGVIRSNGVTERFQAKDANGNNIEDPRNGMAILANRDNARYAYPKRIDKPTDIGDMNAKFRFGFSNSFRYKNFSLDVLIDGKMGGDIAYSAYRFGTHTGVFPNTLTGRDAAHGGVTWTTKFDDAGNGVFQTYDDGILPVGVFAPGTNAAQPNGTSVNVGGMTFEEAYAKGFVEPTHASGYYYRYGSSSTGVADYWVLENSWVSLRQISLAYTLPAKFASKIKAQGINFVLSCRNVGYLYNSLPHNFNPSSFNSTSTAAIGESGYMPMVRSFTGSLVLTF